MQDLDAIATLLDEDEEMTGEGIHRQAARGQGGQTVKSSCACRPAWWRGKRGPRRSDRTWRFLHDGNETAESLGVESGRDGGSTSIGKDEFEVGLGDRDRRDGIGQDSDREEMVVGTCGRTIVAGSGLGPAGLVEVLSKGMERDLAPAADLGLSQTVAAEIIEEGIPA
jgi:hypothetical protein